MAAPLLIASAALGGLQAGQGLYQTITGNRNLKNLFNQRELYKTQDETYDALNLAKNEAQTGFGAQAMSYLTSQSDRAFSSGLDAIRNMGGDPNTVANLLDTQIQNTFKITADSETARMNKVGRVFDGVRTLAASKDAEYASKEALLKDRMAAEAQKVQAGQQNINSGINTTLGAISANQQMNLYKEANKLGKFAEQSATQVPTFAEPTRLGSSLLTRPEMNTTLSSTPQGLTMQPYENSIFGYLDAKRKYKF